MNLDFKALIADITDEACNKNKSKSNKSSALYSNKPENNKDKSKRDGNKKCKHYKFLNLKHNTKNCLASNFKKKKAWETKHNKKFIK